MNQWEIYEMLKGNKALSETEILALEKEPAWIFREAVIEYLLLQLKIRDREGRR